MKRELESHGLECVGGVNGLPEFDTPNPHITVEDIDKYELDEDVGAVI